MTNQGSRPDYGNEVSKRYGLGTIFSLKPFKMFHVARSSPDLYSSTSNADVEGGFCTTVDFPEAQFRELVKLLPADLSKTVREAFAGPFNGTVDVDFPQPFEVNVKAKLGDLIKNDGEEFIPFVAIEVSGHPG